MNQRGFTLVELLVTVAILAILTALLFPVFAQARENGHQSQCLSNTHQLGLACTMYAQDYDDVLSRAFTGNNQGSRMDGASTRWPMLILPYSRNTGIYACSSSSLRFVPPTKARPVSFDDGGYGMNEAYTATTNRFVQPVHVPTGRPLAMIPLPSETIYLADGGGYHGFLWGDTTGPSSPRIYADSDPPMLGSAILTNDGTYSRYSINGRHRGGATFVFCDGHAHHMRLESVAKKNRNGIMYMFTIEEDENI